LKTIRKFSKFKYSHYILKKILKRLAPKADLPEKNKKNSPTLPLYFLSFLSICQVVFNYKVNKNIYNKICLQAGNRDSKENLTLWLSCIVG